MAIRYLNNSGDKWIDTTPGSMMFTLVLPSGEKKRRKGDYFEAFGNFACISYRFCGDRYKAFLKSHCNTDTPCEHDVLRYVFHEGVKDATTRKIISNNNVLS